VCPDVEAGRLSDVIPTVPLDIMGLGIPEKGFQVFSVVSQIDPHVLGSIAHATSIAEMSEAVGGSAAASEKAGGLCRMDCRKRGKL